MLAVCSFLLTCRSAALLRKMGHFLCGTCCFVFISLHSLFPPLSCRGSGMEPTIFPSHPLDSSPVVTCAVGISGHIIAFQSGRVFITSRSSYYSDFSTSDSSPFFDMSPQEIPVRHRLTAGEVPKFVLASQSSVGIPSHGTLCGIVTTRSNLFAFSYNGSCSHSFPLSTAAF